MSEPYPIVPGATYLVTRRCYQRAFRLIPTEAVVRIVTYCLALALSKFGILLHCVCVMSNHMHLVLTDVEGQLPDFVRELHRFIAKSMNVLQGTSDNFWSSERSNYVRLADAQEVIDRIAYVAANPVAAGLVEVPELWPGVILWKEGLVHAERPATYFGRRSKCPEKLSFRISPPPSLSFDPGEWMRAVQKAILAHVADAHRRIRIAGRRFLGREAVLATSFKDRAKSYEASRSLVPTVAATQSATRLALIGALRAFRIAYRDALTSWKGGNRGVVFPHGTWWMRVHHGVRCAIPVMTT